MDGFSFPVEVLKTNRKKSLSIRVNGSNVQVRAPKTISDHRIKKLLEKRTPWIKAKLEEYQQRPQRDNYRYVDDETFKYLGRSYQLKVSEADLQSVKLYRGKLWVKLNKNNLNDPSKIKQLLEDWYQSRALSYLAKKTIQIAKQLGRSPSSISVKNYKSRWGSCSNSGAVSYNWRIIQAPIKIIEYIVVHELCHLIEHNHSPKYWQNVERHIPLWKERRNWLKNNGNLL
jgi:predicted metal-dependent hydrolase